MDGASLQPAYLKPDICLSNRSNSESLLAIVTAVGTVAAVLVAGILTPPEFDDVVEPGEIGRRYQQPALGSQYAVAF